MQILLRKGLEYLHIFIFMENPGTNSLWIPKANCIIKAGLPNGGNHHIECICTKEKIICKIGYQKAFKKLSKKKIKLSVVY